MSAHPEGVEPPHHPSPPPSGPQESRQYAMFAHLAALAGFVVPFGNLVGPLVVWQLRKDDPFVDDQGKESLNFQITVTLAMIACGLLVIVVIGVLLLPVLMLANLALVIMAAIKANEGSRYRYPFALRLIS